MENIVLDMDKQITRLEQEYLSLIQMKQALSKVLLNYSKCENRICDNGEQSIIVYQRKKLANNDFSRIRNIISDI
jgi:hypothetical protein